MSKDWTLDIETMYEGYGMNAPVANMDRETLLKYVEFRLNLLREEVKEAGDAFDLLKVISPADSSPTTQQAREEAADGIVDACVDLCVVAIGTMTSLGVDAHLAWDRVHEKNSQKKVGIKASRPNPLGLPDLVKPEGWTSPSHVDNIGLLSKI